MVKVRLLSHGLYITHPVIPTQIASSHSSSLQYSVRLVLRECCCWGYLTSETCITCIISSELEWAGNSAQQVKSILDVPHWQQVALLSKDHWSQQEQRVALWDCRRVLPPDCGDGCKRWISGNACSKTNHAKWTRKFRQGKAPAWMMQTSFSNLKSSQRILFCSEHPKIQIAQRHFPGWICRLPMGAWRGPQAHLRRRQAIWSCMHQRSGIWCSLHFRPSTCSGWLMLAAHLYLLYNHNLWLSDHHGTSDHISSSPQLATYQHCQFCIQ